MSELLPTTQAPRVQQSILDYLATTFSLADEDARAGLLDLLQDRENGIFKGPYLRLRLPFRPADDGWRDALEWYEGFPPYGHQARAFERLTSLDLGPDKPRSLPTLVTTGTGSGKTEAFLHPILDHVVRAKRRGVSGTKAIVLYPMNALANDQAGRLAGLLTQHQELSGVTAALYTGEQGTPRSRVSATGLITDRHIIRRQAPDILLTNYKMLDQLLLREADQQIWEQSATSLQYLVLDEFHTYDGAQGTDVSMLLRRLGMALKSHWPDDGFTEADRARPLGIITPVATSATLGDKGDPDAMLDFARTVFGEDFGPDAVVTESRLTLDEWLGQPVTDLVPRTDRSALELAAEVGTRVSDGRLIAERVLSALFADEDGAAPMLAGAAPRDLLDLVKVHPITRAMVEAAEHAVSLDALVDAVLPSYAADPDGRAVAEQVLLLWSAVLSHVRKEVGRDAVSVELHLWVRELSRIDRRATGAPDYLWSDDRHLALGGDDGTDAVPAFPAVYCRHCGRSGWAVLRAPVGGFDLTGADPDDVRRASLLDDREFRALIHAPAEAEADEGARSSDPDEPRLMWLHAEQRRVLPSLSADDAEVAEGRVLPVLAHAGPGAGDLSRDDTCPSCLQKDGIRFLGSAVATLLSVSLSTIFGSDDLDQAEKKSLVFTDSVQDAAHRAGFVQSRSHRLTLRAVLRAAVGDDPITLDHLVQRVLEQAGNDPHQRYRLLPPEHADRSEFEPFWREERQRRVAPAVLRRVRTRLLLDVVLEVGLQSRLGRTLELTGSLAAQVEASRGVLLRAANDVEKALGQQHLDGLGVTDDKRVRWVRGVLERMRTDGAIQHEWFRRFQAEDGRRYSIWGGRPATDGMPAFPRGRPAPGYPRVGGGGGPRGDNDLVPAASAKGWYAVWTARALGCSPAEGASVVVELLKQLAALDVVQVVNTQSGAQVYEILPSRVLVQPVGDVELADGGVLLVCNTCGDLHPGTPQVVDELEGAPCQVLRCRGSLVRASGEPDNFYRRLYAAADTTRVIAREHTSLLPDETRLAYETEFKAGASNPAAPNVLVATPTLEMGIDIGDLSTVMLAGLPRSVASYLQRVGRAGRLTGSALNLAFVSGRGEQLPRLGDPLSVVNGAVRPPATYLDAEEILRRQYLASVADTLARTATAPHPSTPAQAIGSIEPGSFLHALGTAAEDAGALDAFVAGFDDLSATARDGLKQWAIPGATPLTSPMAAFLHEQRHHWFSRVETVQHRIGEIQAELPELQERAALPAATDDDKLAVRTAVAGLGLARMQLADLRDGYWIGVLEEHGILPNYTLLDDTVGLDVTLSWLDPESQEYRSEEQSFHRASSLALRDLAPGATFYANRHQLLVDAVDLGHEGEAVRPWALCAACGHAQPRDGGAQPPASCPRCGDTTIADVRQTVDVVELTNVSSAVRREEATIDDGSDDRKRAGFEVVTAADVGIPRMEWHVDQYPLGVKHLHGMTIRWLNLGRIGEPSSGSVHVSGQEHAAALFRVCARCGKVDTGTRRNAATEHRPWCPQRHAIDEDVRAIALSRTLQTEGVTVRLPATITLGDRFAVPSLIAAFQLGLREHLGGTPDHLAVEQVVDPHLSDGSDNRDALLVHDKVPGGTGYLAELSEPQKLWSVLRQAWLVVRDCPCQDEDRAACHRCLSPWINGPTGRWVSRLAAERHLHDILTAGGTLPEPDEALGWTVVQQPTAADDPETHIEQRFRTVFRKRLTEGLGASVSEQPGPHGNRWTIVLGGRTWTLEPQLLLGNVKPDFVLVCNDPDVPRVAVFCDGWRFHASPAVNNLAADATKRASLRAQGFVVLSLTWQDLDAAEQSAATPPPWFDDARWSKVLGASHGALRPAHRDLVTGGPIDLLVSWIASPDRDGLRALAELLPLLLIGAGDAGKTDASEPLLELVGSLHNGQALPGDGAQATWSWRYDTMTVLARRTTGTASEVAVMVDDRADVLGQAHKQAWNEWLRLANLLNLRLQEATVLTCSQLAAPSSAAVAPASDQEPSTSATYAEPWPSLLEQVVGAAAAALVRDLADLDLIPPVVGGEAGDGIVVEIAWPDIQLVVDLDLTEEDRHDLVQDGWNVVPPEAAAVQQALEPAGAP